MKTPSVRKQDLDAVLGAIKELRTELQSFIAAHTASDKEQSIKQALLEQKIDQLEKDVNLLGQKIEKDAISIEDINRRIYTWAGGLAVGSAVLSIVAGHFIQKLSK